jgi:hypothetical protein
MTPDRPAAPEDAPAGSRESFFRERLEALHRGESSVETLMAAAESAIAANPDCAWELLALTDQYYRRRQLRGDAYRAIKRRFERRMLGVLDADGDLLALPAHPGHHARAAHHVPTLGRLLRDRYVVEAFLGEGEHGTVLRALDRFRLDLPMCGRHVALKVLRDEVADIDSLTELRREFQCSQRLAHPNIVKVFEIDRDGDTTFFTMEALQGEALHRMLARHQDTPLAREHAFTLIRRIGEALQHAHGRGVVHGNLRARKVIITDEGDIRVFGFGARADADRADDLQALASLAYELLTGVPPFSQRVDARGRDLERRHAGEPCRRSGLSHRHWKAIELALSSRARQISVSDWLDLMGADRCPERLPGRLGAAPARPSRYARPQVGVLALMAAAIGGFGLAFLWRAPRPVGLVQPTFAASAATILGDATAASVAANAADAADAPTTPPPGPRLPGSRELSPLWRPPAGASSASVMTLAPAPPRLFTPIATTIASAKPATAHPARPGQEPQADIPPLRISAPAYTVSPNQSLASISVRRTPGVRGDITFVWWTEGATARAGEDFIATGQRTERLAAGAESMAFLIPIAPTAERANKRFYVVAQVGGHEGRVQRATVVLKADSSSALASTR